MSVKHTAIQVLFRQRAPPQAPPAAKLQALYIQFQCVHSCLAISRNGGGKEDGGACTGSATRQMQCIVQKDLQTHTHTDARTDARAHTHRDTLYNPQPSKPTPN
mmetsp:Transcript_4625/g.8344  ORF Transcript_4625/g.8344 Transcript_4625/m.8344 type:complete len:104 (-) Transcript_4625:213-524(-)